jgi:holo-[acyl-carrier protein] synthase
LILGVGTDIVAVDRIRVALARFGDAFAERMLTPLELLEYRRNKFPATFLAKRFAAKEALSKALGTGLRPPVTCRHIQVVHDLMGKPDFVFNPELARWLEERGVKHWHLSTSDEREYACAFVVVED